MSNVPIITEEQRSEALAKAMEARMTLARAKKSLKEGFATPGEILNDPAYERMRAKAFIESIPGYGKHRAQALMERIGISPSRRLRGLGCRQRKAILEAVDEH